jgi:hypothetical protein
MSSENPDAVVSGALPRLELLRSVRTDVLEAAYQPSPGGSRRLRQRGPGTGASSITLWWRVMFLTSSAPRLPCDCPRSARELSEPLVGPILPQRLQMLTTVQIPEHNGSIIPATR